MSEEKLQVDRKLFTQEVRSTQSVVALKAAAAVVANFVAELSQQLTESDFAPFRQKAVEVVNFFAHVEDILGVVSPKKEKASTTVGTWQGLRFVVSPKKEKASTPPPKEEEDGRPTVEDIKKVPEMTEETSTPSKRVLAKRKQSKQKNVTQGGEPSMDELFSQANDLLNLEKKEPVAKEAKPVAKEEEPVAKEAKPVAKEEEPVAKEAKPVAKEAKPVAKEEEPEINESYTKINATQVVLLGNMLATLHGSTPPEDFILPPQKVDEIVKHPLVTQLNISVLEGYAVAATLVTLWTAVKAAEDK